MLDFIEPLDYVVVSGDITTGGNREGFKQFEIFVREMQDRKVFPPSNHFVIVPGNHDVGKIIDGMILPGCWVEVLCVHGLKILT